MCGPKHVEDVFGVTRVKMQFANQCADSSQARLQVMEDPELGSFDVYFQDIDLLQLQFIPDIACLPAERAHGRFPAV